MGSFHRATASTAVQQSREIRRNVFVNVFIAGVRAAKIPTAFTDT